MRSTTASAYRSRDTDSTAEHQFDAFVKQDRANGIDLAEHLFAADTGSRVFTNIAMAVRTAHDDRSEIPVPAQGLPTYTALWLAKCKKPQPPPPLLTDWLVRLPAQKVPPGFESMSWIDMLKPWARKQIADHLNQLMEHDIYCFNHGAAPDEINRPGALVLDSTAALNIPHRNGIGSWNAMEIIYERRGDGLYVPRDFTAKGQTQWMIKNIARILGPTVTDRELLSFIFDGVR